VVERFDSLCDKTLPELKTRAEGIVLARIAEKAHRPSTEVKLASSSAILQQFRRLVHEGKLLRDLRSATHKSIAALQPDLVDLMRGVVRANATDSVLYKRGDTPVDEILIQPGARGSGGQTERFTRILNAAIADRGMDIRAISEGGARALLRAAEVKQLGVLHNFNPPKVGAHFCAAEIVLDASIAYIFSGIMRRLSIDQKSNLKCNSDHNTSTAGGHSKGGLFQIVTERVMTYSHGAGGDYLAKFGLFSMFMYPTSKSCCHEELRDFELNEHVETYNADQHFLEQPGLAVCLGHCQAKEPENAFRDFADLSEMIQKYPHYFLAPDLGIVPALSIEKDNAHGVGDMCCRMACVIFAVLHDFDYLNIGSQEAGMSLYHGVETMNGALGRRVNGRPFMLPLLAPESASAEELSAAMDEVLRVICERADGATFNAGGGFISVHPARETPLASGFVWRPAELSNFVSAAKCGKAHTFEFELMESFPAYRELILRSWSLLHASGALACTKLTAHTFQVYSFCFNSSLPVLQQLFPLV